MTTDPTPDPTEPLDLATVRARVEAATPGPWVADPDEAGIVLSSRNGGWDGRTVAVLQVDDDGLLYNPADAEFIAHARQDVPALLAEVERLRGERFEAVMALAWLAPSVTQNGRLAHAVRVAREALIAAEAERDALAAQLDGLRAGIRHMAGLMAEAPGTYADAIRDVATDTIQRIESLLGGDESEARTDG